MNLISSNVSTIISQLKSYQKGLDNKAEKVVDKLTSEGAKYMQDRANSVVYDGDTSGTTVIRNAKGKKGEVSYTGDVVTFIEFGTGTYYPDDHPQAGEMGMVRGEYGKGLGANPPWHYVGNPGSNGDIIPNSKGRQVVRTMGNPANRVVYDTGKQMKERASAVLREVYEK